MKKTKISIVCLGCPKNLADMEYIIAGLKDIEITNEAESQIVIINTCGFLKSAREEVFENIEELKDKKIIIIGCMASMFDEKLLKRYPQIFAVLSSANYEKINKTISQASENIKNFLINKEPESFSNYDKKTLIYDHPFAYVKIAEGCDNKCGYCLIPYLKGKYRSRKMESILSECKTLIKNGIKEIILVAQDCGHYGIDLYKKKSLSDLLEKIEKIPGNFWIRILYTYPEKVDKKLIETIKKSKKICKYLDIPLQHGSSEILKQMRRPYNTKKTQQIIKNIRKEIPEISIRTSFIVGYPGETEKDFSTLKEYIEKLEIDLVGIFEFSKEKNTYAYSLENQIKSVIKKSRRNLLMKVQQKISLKKNKKIIGNKEKILIESFIKEQNIYTGRSEKFAPEIDGIVYVKSSKPLKIGNFIEVEIEDANEYDLFAKAL